MTAMKRWSVEIYLDEHEEDGKTHAEARLHTADTTHLRGHGSAKRDPADSSVPEIGDELAAARALSALAHELLHAAARDIEQVTHQPAHVHG